MFVGLLVIAEAMNCWKTGSVVCGFGGYGCSQVFGWLMLGFTPLLHKKFEGRKGGYKLSHCLKGDDEDVD